MAELTQKASTETSIALLTEAYRTILGHYRKIERLSRKEKRVLEAKQPVANVNAILRAKKELLREVRVEEERVRGEREWWKRFRRSVAPAVCADLLSLLDAISRSIEATVALETECRGLLEGAVRGGGAVPERSASTRQTGAMAYAREHGGGAAR